MSAAANGVDVGPGKFTIILQASDDQKFERLAAQSTEYVGDTYGRKVNKADVLRAVIRLADRDEDFRCKILEEIERALT